MEFVIKCGHCRKKITPAKGAEEGSGITRFTKNDSLIRDETFRRFYCSNCGKSTMVFEEHGSWVAPTHAPSFLFLPHYCKIHEISYFDPAGSCPFCVTEGRVVE